MMREQRLRLNNLPKGTQLLNGTAEPNAMNPKKPGFPSTLHDLGASYTSPSQLSWPIPSAPRCRVYVAMKIYSHIYNTAKKVSNPEEKRNEDQQVILL